MVNASVFNAYNLLPLGDLHRLMRSLNNMQVYPFADLGNTSGWFVANENSNQDGKFVWRYGHSALVILSPMGLFPDVQCCILGHKLCRTAGRIRRR
jgi:hypothetical protein